jgi:FtsZ-binding cell division protein ZapB
MDTTNIPKAFWYSLSFCMVVGTLGLLTIAYKANSVSIEIANAKIELQSAVSQTKEIKAMLEAESKQLTSESKLFQENVGALRKLENGSLNKSSIEELSKGLGQPAFAAADFRYKSEFEALDKKIKSAEETIRK